MIFVYCFVRWGGQTRIAERVSTLEQACRQTYGMVAENMEVLPYSPRKADCRVNRRRELAFKSTAWVHPQAGWIGAPSKTETPIRATFL